MSDSNMIDENACIRCKEERHGIGGGSDNSIDMYKCQVGCDGYSWDTEFSLPKPIQYFKSGWKSNVEE